jgi:hypothetical protein
LRVGEKEGEKRKERRQGEFKHKGKKKRTGRFSIEKLRERGV